MDGPAREALGSHGVTRRELEVLDLVAQRWTNAEIAERLGVSERTVESYVSSLLRKLSGRRRLDLAVWAKPAVPSMPEHLDGMEQRGPCFGRDPELARLLEGWERAAVRTTIAVIRGEAGIGKSRLTAAFAAAVARRGGRVVVGCCDAEHDRPFQPFIDAIVDDDRRHAVPERPRHEGSADLLDRLVPGRAGPSHDLVDLDGERAAVHAAIQAHFASIASEDRLVLVIEDVQWASAGTRDVISRIARSPAEAPFMLVTTMREERGRGDDDFGRFLAGLANLPAVETLSLGGLDLAAVGRLIDEVGSDLDPRAALAQTDGNPLYVRELAREGVASRALRDLVADRFARLRADHLDLLDLAVVAGAQLDVPLLAAAADRSIDDVLDAAEQAEAAGLIASGGGPSRLVFAHDVFRAVREASLTAGRKVRLHARLAEALHRTVVDGQHLGRLARHACLGAPSFDSRVAAELARRAGDASADATDHGGAVEHYRRGLDALELAEHDDGALRSQLTIGLGSCLVLTGDGGGYAVLRDSALVARRRGDPVGLTRAFCAAAIVPGGAGFARALDPEFAAMAEDALATLPLEERAWRCRITAQLGVQLLVTTDVERGTELVIEAVEAARTLGDPLTLGRALLSFRFAGGPLDMEQRIACGEELIELGRQTGVNLFAAVGNQQLGWC